MMSGILGFHTREAVRVKVKKCEGLMCPEYKKFSVDPQITSFEVLQNLLARAFDIKGCFLNREFTISYLARDDEGQETYLSLLSDWDLDAAFLSSSEPCLQLKVDLKPFEEAGLEDWDIIAPVDIPRPQINDKQSITGTILNHMERTISLVQRALNIGDNENGENVRPLKVPMSDSEFHNYLDSCGQLVQPKELRMSVYRGGLEPSLRKVVWKHILNVYPEGLSGSERMSYMKQRKLEYERLCKIWKSMMDTRTMTDEMQFVTNMVRKDVLRTDRTHKFYAGSDDNKNVASLFNILTTYALNHPSVSYCQGMSDLASPILVTMKDEAQAYVCFCALMKRLKPNFQLDGQAMTKKFQHLSELLQYYDPQFFEYLKQQGADDLLFCYRWLLLELKREFAFDDALLMLEVLWSSLPPMPPVGHLQLYETEFTGDRLTGPQSPLIHSRENPYTKVRAIRKQNSTSSIKGLVKGASQGEFSTRTRQENDECCYCECIEEGSSSGSNTTIKEHSVVHNGRRSSMPDGELSADDSQEYPPMTTSITRELRIDLENLNRQLPGSIMYFCSDEIDSPLSRDGCDVRTSNHFIRKMSIEQMAVTDGEDPQETQSWTSDDQSGDHIHHIGSLRRRRKCIDYLHINGGPAEYEGGQCCTPDEQCEIDFDEHVKCTIDSNCNGEILENEESETDRNCTCHLKSVIPIRLVQSPVREDRHRHGSSSSDTSSSSEPYPVSVGPNGEPIQANYPALSKNHSEGYGSDGTISSKEASVQEDSPLLKTSRFYDSGVVEPTLNNCEEALDFSVKNRRAALPPPQELGDGNPFMLFLCLTLLLQHRDVIIRNRMDYNELAMHFDKMVRKHHVLRVVNQARTLFAEYLKMGWQENSWDVSCDLNV